MQRINGVHENISSPAGTYSGFKVFNEQTETAFHSANAIYINPPCSPSEAVCIYQSIVECVRPVKPFGLGLKVRMPGSGLFFFLSAQKATGVCRVVLLHAWPPPSTCVPLNP